MTIKGSLDLGKSWPIEKEIYSGTSAYSDLVQVDAKNVLDFFTKEIIMEFILHSCFLSKISPINLLLKQKFYVEKKNPLLANTTLSFKLCNSRSGLGEF